MFLFSRAGYKQLIKHANTQGATVESDAAFRSQHHSAAYEQAFLFFTPNRPHSDGSSQEQLDLRN